MDVPAPSARPTHAPPQVTGHPEEIDPLGKMHHQKAIPPEERHLIFILSIGLVATLLLVPIISAISGSPVVNVFLGLSPLILTLILDMVVTMQHYKPVTFWAILIIVHFFALGALSLLNFLLLPQLNVISAVSISLVLGIIVTVICWLSNPRLPKAAPIQEFKPEKLQEYVQSIEDKVKALNFAIGRVYRTSNGASAKMRERLRIPSEWYNEFNTIKPEEIKEQEDKAKVLLRKIRDRLSLYSKQEKDVFSEHELANLKNIARHKHGEDTIIAVLKTNDSDPVENYYVSAVEFCDKILEELEKL